MAKIIEVLPEACVNVELDTRDYDESAPKSVHLCDDLRAILPRLQGLLLCLTAMCPAIFMNGKGCGPSDEHYSPLTLVVAPFLQTFIVSRDYTRF